ncbi:MAG: hypothetical protein A3E25_08520 [Burkholderiales bacterium RIFCSPHIGHO2_12_FULL_69_20]|nr:MAG: hypothetical protein A3E25_08520 [Burkholderiales bacterium RIFCSPHIGHO2_12_FULL_69_20]
MNITVRPLWPLALLASALLAGCGGGDDDTSAAATAGAGTLTLSAATPAANNTTIDLSTATSKGNNARAADGFSAAAYCEVFWENATAANGLKYAVQVYFRQSDKAVLHASVIEPNFVIFNNDSGNAITGVTVDTAAKTLAFTTKVLSGGAGEIGTLSGTVGFPANTTTAACGS